MVFICSHMHASILYTICTINSSMYTHIIIYTSILSSYVSSIGIGLYHLITLIFDGKFEPSYPPMLFLLVQCMVRFLDPFRFDGSAGFRGLSQDAWPPHCIRRFAWRSAPGSHRIHGAAIYGNIYH